MRKGFLLFFLTLLSQTSASAEIPTSLKCLWDSYRNFKITADKRDIIFPSGRILPFESRPDHPTPIDPRNLSSIDQMFLTPYPLGRSYTIPSKKDILRGSRYTRFFTVLYGNSPSIVEQDLETVYWVDGSPLEFNKSHGAAAHLRAVVKDLKALIKSQPEFKRFLRAPLGGTYNWRHVSHEHQLSMHSFGVAIDINLNYADYWRWDLDSSGKFQYRNRIPLKIVEIFENHGFIWGGKWYHYDTMHFEYRPELLLPQKDCVEQFADYKD